MFNKKLSKIYAGCALAMALAIASTPVIAFAEEPTTPAHKEVNAVDPGKTAQEKETKASDPTKLTGIDPTDEDDTATVDTYEGYVDTDIDVWGHTENGTVYSVDVEWGAMTFQYETGSWDPATHTKKDGAGWQVYDNTQDKVLGDVQDAINRVTVTNHSNAAVYAKLSYTGEATYTDTIGTFEASTKADTEDIGGASFDVDKKLITLPTADNGSGGAAGTATVGNVYFKPTGIKEDLKTNANGIAKWTKIGKITVGILTEEPAATP